MTEGRCCHCGIVFPEGASCASICPCLAAASKAGTLMADYSACERRTLFYDSRRGPADTPGPPKCECGSAIAGVPHAKWCPLYKPLPGDY